MAAMSTVSVQVNAVVKAERPSVAFTLVDTDAATVTKPVRVRACLIALPDGPRTGDADWWKWGRRPG